MLSPIRARLVPRQTLLYAALAFSAGIVIGTYAWRPATWWVLAAVTLLAAAFYLSRPGRMLSVLVALLGWLSFGSLLIKLRPETRVPEIGPFLNDDEVIITGHVVGEGELRQAGSFAVIRAQIFNGQARATSWSFRG